MVDDSTGPEVAERGGVESFEGDSQAGFLGEHLRPARADGQVDRPAGPAEDLQEPDGVGGAAGAGHGQDEGKLAVAHLGPTGLVPT